MHCSSTESELANFNSTKRGDATFGSGLVSAPWQDIAFTTGNGSIKGRNMLRDPHICFCVDNQIPPFCTVNIDGISGINKKPDPEKLLNLI